MIADLRPERSAPVATGTAGPSGVQPAATVGRALKTVDVDQEAPEAASGRSVPTTDRMRDNAWRPRADR